MCVCVHGIATFLMFDSLIYIQKHLADIFNIFCNAHKTCKVFGSNVLICGYGF